MRLHDTIYESKDATKYYATSFYTTIQYKATSAVYVALYNTTTLWHSIGLIWVVMGCYVRKPKFADAIRPNHDRPPPTGCNTHYTGPNDGSCHLGPMSYSGSKNCSNVCSFANDCIGIGCWHNPGLWKFCPIYYIILAFWNILDHVIWIRIHREMGQTKLSIIGAVFWPSIILLSSTLYDLH